MIIMLDALRDELNKTLTENGALAYSSTLNCCLDFFAMAGAIRFNQEEDIVSLFTKAYSENPDAAMKLLFYSRDIRFGMGERRVFRTILKYLAYNYPESVIKNLEYISEFGRYDDMTVLFDTKLGKKTAEYISNQLESDLAAMSEGKSVSLLAKWLPSVNCSSKEAKENAVLLCKLMGISQKEYRKKLSSLRSYIDVLEKRLCKKDYTFKYESQPSKAMYKYRNAFLKHDRVRYSSFIESVSKGETKLNAGTVYPYEIVRDCLEPKSLDDRKILDATWKSLTDISVPKNALAVVDGSGSMYWSYNNCQVTPATVALSLGIYFAEHTQGTFHDYFITFSENPRLVKIQGNNIFEKVKYCQAFNECANTNLERVFSLLLTAAVKNKLPQSELPEIIYVISDMQFDQGCVSSSQTIFKTAELNYKKAGYKLPTIVYWNVAGRRMSFPVKDDTTGAVLVSGCSPNIFRHMIDQRVNPEIFMREIIEDERYSCISA